VRASFNVMRVGPKLKRRAMELTGSTARTQIINTDGDLDTVRAASSTYEVSGGTAIPNTWNGQYDLVVDERVTNYYWDLHDTRKGYKSMILFVTRAPEPIALTDMTDNDRFYDDDYVWSVECDVGVAAGHWYATYRGTGTE
jgi:phage major head subunit gpT-like protein